MLLAAMASPRGRTPQLRGWTKLRIDAIHKPYRFYTKLSTRWERADAKAGGDSQGEALRFLGAIDWFGEPRE
jgi:hypothetical protein